MPLPGGSGARKRGLAGLRSDRLSFAPGGRSAGRLAGPPPLGAWIHRVEDALVYNQENFPFMAYGTDWLAFAHIMLAVLFLGAMRDPARNLWVIEFGLLACAGVLALALICGPGSRSSGSWWIARLEFWRHPALDRAPGGALSVRRLAPARCRWHRKPART